MRPLRFLMVLWSLGLLVPWSLGPWSRLRAQPTATTSTVAITANKTTGAITGPTSAATLAAANSFATYTGSETLSNKTLTTPTINGATISGTFTGPLALSGNLSATGSGPHVISGQLQIAHNSGTYDAIRITNGAAGGKSWTLGDGAGVTAGNFGFYSVTNSTLLGYFTPSGTFNVQSLLYANSPTASTSTTTGSLIVAGGIGVGGRITAGEHVYAVGRVDASGTNAYFTATDGAVTTKLQSVLATPGGYVGTQSNHDLYFYTNNTNRGTISAAGAWTIASNLTVSADTQTKIGTNRPFLFDPSTGKVEIKANAGAWDTGYKFQGSAGTVKGGFGAFGDTDALTYFYVGPSYSSTYAQFASTGTTFPASVVSSGPTGGIGYTTGSGGAQTQATSKSTAVTSNTVTTAITMNAASLAAATVVSFTFTNSAIAATDTVIVTHSSGGTGGAYTTTAFPAAGSATIYVRNNTAGALAEAIVLRVTVIKSVSS